MASACVGRISVSVIRRMERLHTAEGVSERSNRKWASRERLDAHLRLEYTSTLSVPTWAF